jgi:hypothetical protein
MIKKGLADHSRALFVSRGMIQHAIALEFQINPFSGGSPPAEDSRADEDGEFFEKLFEEERFLA